MRCPLNACSDRLVVLRDGFTVEESVLRQLWALEGDGLRIHLADDGADLLVGPPSLLTYEVRAFLLTYKRTIVHLLAVSEVSA